MKSTILKSFVKKLQISMQESIVILNGIRLVEIAVGELDPEKIKTMSCEDACEVN